MLRSPFFLLAQGQIAANGVWSIPGVKNPTNNLLGATLQALVGTRLTNATIAILH